jgi:hypothetical protein
VAVEKERLKAMGGLSERRGRPGIDALISFRLKLSASGWNLLGVAMLSSLAGLHHAMRSTRLNMAERG